MLRKAELIWVNDTGPADTFAFGCGHSFGVGCLFEVKSGRVVSPRIVPAVAPGFVCPLHKTTALGCLELCVGLFLNVDGTGDRKVDAQVPCEGKRTFYVRNDHAGAGE